MKKLFIIDSYSSIFKSYYAMARNPLTNKAGENVSAVFGYFSTLLSVFKEFNPDYVVICADSGGGSFRDQLYPDYKAHRTEAPEDLKSQFIKIEEGIRISGIVYLSLNGYEADDIIASVANHFAHENELQIYIFSTDKDFMQIISDNIFLMRSSNKNMERIVFDKEKVLKEKGVTTSQFIDYQALCGDSIDNIPGVKGIGEKTAIALIQKYNSLEGIYENLNLLPKGQKEKLENQRDQAFMSRVLATLKTDIKINVSLKEMSFDKINFNGMSSFFTRSGFSSLVKIVEKEWAKDNANLEFTFEDKPETQIEIQKIPVLEYDEEKLLSEEGELFLYFENNNITVFSKEFGMELESKNISPCLKRFLSEKEFIFVNFKEVCKFLLKKGISVKAAFCMNIASYLLNSELESYSVNSMLFYYLKIDSLKFKREELLFQFINLYKVLEQEILTSSLSWLLHFIEIPLARVLCKMEINGIGFDKQMADTLKEKIQNNIKKLESEIYNEAGEVFNILSTNKLQEILFIKRGLRQIKKIKAGYSTENSVLKELAKEDPLCNLILKYRTYRKINSSYIEIFPKFLESDGRIRTVFGQLKTATGRLSSDNPNLQNIPTNTEEFKIRDCFVSKEGYSFLSADYSQIELVVMAYYSKDDTMLSAIKHGIDIHKKTAAKIFNKHEDEVDKDLRNIAKAVNFGTIYGISSYGLSINLGISTGVAKEFLESYFREFKSVEDFLGKALKIAEEKSEVRTIFNRRRIIAKASSETMRRQNQRLAVNSIIQGSSADIIKKAMIEVDKSLSKDSIFKIYFYPSVERKYIRPLLVRAKSLEKFKKIANKMRIQHVFIKSRRLDANLLLQIHDELILECKDSDINRLKILLKKKMSSIHGFGELSSLIKVNLKSGKRWGEI